MKVAVYEGNQQFSIREVETPKPAADQVLARITHSAICGTDVHAFMYDLAPQGTVLGHEIAGEIVEIGENVQNWKTGQRVVAGGGDTPPGHEAPNRSAPRYNFRERGFEVSHNGYAEYTLIDSWRLLEIPDQVSGPLASLTEPCAVAVRALRRSAVKLGSTVAILGAGPIGLLCLQAAQTAGATRVLVSEPSETRRKVATELGAYATIDPLTNDVVENFVELTNGIGPDVVFDCAGIGNSLDQAFNMAGRNGQVVLVAVPWQDLPIRPVDWMAHEGHFTTSFGRDPEDWRIGLELLASKKISGDALMVGTSMIKLEEIQESFEALANPTSEVQVVIEM